MKVLSIDFDYFQKASKEALYTYPDGHDFGSELSMLIWSGHYANPRERKLLESVTVDQDKLNKVIDLIQKQNVFSEVLIAQSHAHLAGFIRDNNEDNEPIELINLDMHHDTFKQGTHEAKTFEEVDCGNWGTVLFNQYPGTQITWVNQEGSEIFGDGDKRLKITSDLDSVLDEDYDLIFICRSDIWLPPHLDKDFDKLFQAACNHFYQVKYDPQIKEPRDMKIIEERIKAEKQFLKENFPEQYKRVYGEEPDLGEER